MQQELDTSHPELSIQILGVNMAGLEAGNDGMTFGRDLPWLQDVDANNNGSSDVWVDSWGVTFRDVVILDGDNVKVGAFNLTVNDLSNPAHYDALRGMLVAAAIPEPSSIAILGIGLAGALAAGWRRKQR